MANKNLLKKIAPVILSATVAMTGMPSAAFAAEFSDENMILNENAEDEESDVEITDEDAAADNTDTDVTVEDAEEEDAETVDEEENTEAEDAFGTEADAGAFNAEDEADAVSGDFVYGTANIPYADFFYGEMNDVAQNATMQLDAADPVTAAGYRDEGMYDAVTSCTNSKSKRYDTSYYTENTENGSVTLEGIKAVNIAVPASLYNDAKKAIEEGKSCSNQLLKIAGSLENVSETAPASGEYKILNGDGTLTAMTTETKELNVESSITASSPWGNYQVSVEFGNNNPDQPTTANMMGVIFETSDGEKYGMEHSQNLWLRTGEIAFAVKDGFVEPHKNTIDSKRSAGLEGKTITKITYLVKDGADIVIPTNLLCKYKLADGQGITGPEEKVVYTNNTFTPTKVQLTYNVPEGSSYKLTSVEYGGQVLSEGSYNDYTYDDSTKVLSVYGGVFAKTGVGTYTLTFTDSSAAPYEDITVPIVLSADDTKVTFAIQNNKLVKVDPNGSTTYEVKDYIKNITAIKVDGQALGGRKANISEIAKSVFNESTGAVNFDAKVNNTAVFAKGDGGSYEIELTSSGFNTVTGTVAQDSGEYKYVYAGLTWEQYWEAEGVYEATNTSSSDKKDRRNESDLGGFDAVTRATANHGLHRGSFQTMATVYDANGKTYALAGWKDKTTMILTDGSTVSCSKGKINGIDVTEYKVTGLKYIPVKVKTADYDAFKKAFKVVENGEKLFGGYAENSLSAYEETAEVNANTNGLKTATKDGDTFTFSARANGTTSGLKGEALKTADGITTKMKPGSGSYGEFLRVDLTGNYGGLGGAMQAVKWTYYGDDDTYSNALQSYGTKFAADNWMHKFHGIQLALTDSVRCKLPADTDGTGYWEVTVYGLGYSDYTFRFQATDENIAKPAGDADSTPLKNIIAEAKALKEADYTPDSWDTLVNELEECEDMLANIANQTQYGIEEQIGHLREAIDSLVKAEFKLNQTSATLYSGAAVTLSATTNLTGDITWKSSDAKVATVDAKGNVKAVNAGTATITATLGKVSATFTVTVKNPSITAKADSSVIYTKSKTTTKINVVKDGVTGNATFRSSNKKVATVSANGTVKAKKAGKVNITVQVGNHKQVVKITVKKPTMKLTKSSAKLKKGKKVTIKVKAAPVSKVTFKSSNKKVATVSSKGVVKAKKKGTAIITVKCNGITKKFKVTVK
ncbi:penicillin-binding Tp47 domain C-containing protein [Blautia intestinalis]|uniref:penicillin-binding Tp47 domain C-containing protein n=1 Tax=Blautia intestinalis TaxID=2763028 RepID=UPI0022E83B92|nr:penicillin-binding Tp47 domain C-containing protein [Blautia intestinalis]